MRTCNRIIQAINPAPKPPPGEVHDCQLCGRPTVFSVGTPEGDRVCGKCQRGIDRLLSDIERIPDPPGQASDPNLLAALSMSIVAARMDAEREREHDADFESHRR